MNYDNPELQRRLAAEYVLGTLQGAARRRFETLLAEKDGLRRAVAAWERRLTPWAVAVKPVPVPDRVWHGVQRRLGLVKEAPEAGLRGWRWWAFGSTAAAAVLAMVLVLWPQPVPPPSWKDVAVLSTDKAEAVWVVRARADGRALQLSGLARVNVPAGHDLELWAIPAGKAPQSLGVLHRSPGGAELLLDERARARLSSAAVLAVSLEPAGGSPTGAPTGPVLYTGRRAG